MRITTSTQEDITIVELQGRLDSHTSTLVQEKILETITENAKILIDMQDVEFMSSAGLRILLIINRTIASNHGQVALVGVSQKLQDIMSMTGFLRFFTFYDVIEDGIAALRDGN